MRMLTVIINDRRISFQVTKSQLIRFGHLYLCKVEEGIQLKIQAWKPNKKPDFVFPDIFNL